MAYCVDKYSSAALCRGGMVLCRAKVPKALCHPIVIGSSNEPFAPSHAYQKNSSTPFNQL